MAFLHENALFLKKIAKKFGHVKKKQYAFEKKTTGAVVQLVRIPACHAVGREFESRPHRRTSESWFPFQS